MVRGETRQKMIDTALELIHRQGVNATSVDQILSESGTGKSQFSHYFKTKDGLVGAVLDYLYAVIREGKAPTGYDVRTWKDLEGWFRNYIDFQKSVKYRMSCPIGTIGTDLTDDQKELRRGLDGFIEWSRGELARFFREKKSEGELVRSADPEGLADFCIAIMQGGMLLTKMRRDSSMFENAAAQALAHIRSLRVRK